MAKGEAYRAAVLEGPTKRKNKKSSRSTKPSALNLDGTLYRAINAITCESGRGLFCLTRKQHSRQDVDSKKAHQSSWDGMHGIYSDSGNEDIGKLSGPALVGHKVDTNIASEYDELNVDEFQEVVLFILSHFKSARNRKNTSGQHKPFNNFIDGKSWILYFHNVIESVGDKALGDCTYAELDNDVKVTSDKVHATENTLRRRRSPSPPSTSQSKKDLIEARKAVSDAVAMKNSEMTLIGQFSRISELRDIIFKGNEKMTEVKAAIKVAKEKLEDADNRSAAEMLEVRAHVQRLFVAKRRITRVTYFRPRLNMNL